MTSRRDLSGILLGRMWMAFLKGWLAWQVHTIILNPQPQMHYFIIDIYIRLGENQN
jgi:hypothetical protein